VLMIGTFRGWMKRKIKEVDEKYWGSKSTNTYINGYKRAMEDVAKYMDFPLDDDEWEKW